MLIHELNSFSTEFINEISKKIIAKVAIGLVDLEGKIFEKMLADIYDEEWRGSNDGLIDVLIQVKLGYSVKSLDFDRKGFPYIGNGQRFDTILGRLNPDTYDGSHIVPPSHTKGNITDAAEAGEIILNIWNSRLRLALNACMELRQLTLMKSKNLKRWILFESVPQFLDYKTFHWVWRPNGKKNMTLYGENEKQLLKWQPNGSQTTLNQSAPDKRCLIILPDEIPSVPDCEILDRINYNPSWLRVETTQ